MGLRTTIFGSVYMSFTGFDDLRIGAINGTAFELLFTPPSKPVSYYEVFVNNVLHSTLQGSGDYVVLLQQQTTCSVKVKAIFSTGYGAFTNTVTGTTGTSFVMQNDLLSYYKFDDLNSAALDSFGTYDGTYVGAGITHNEIGKINKCFKMTADEDYIDLVNNLTITPTTTSPFSVVIWAKPTIIRNATYANRAFTFKKNPSQSALILGFDNSNKAFFFINGLVFRVTSVSVNNWYLFGITFNGSKFTMYFNGKRVFELTEIMPDLINTPVQIAFKNPSFSADSDELRFEGFADELPIYQRALTAGEMSDYFNNESGITLI